MKFITCVWRVAFAVLISAAVLSCDNGVQGGGSSGGGTGTGGGGGFGPPGPPTTYVPFVPVTDISGVPGNAILGTDLPLTGTVAPFNATGKTIIWTVEDGNDNGTGVTVLNGILQTRGLVHDAPGVDYSGGVEIVVTATIARGAVDPATNNFADYTEDFTIIITQPDYGVQLSSVSQVYSRPVGYEPFNPVSISVRNIGAEDTGIFSIALEGDAASFTATGTTASSPSLSNGDTAQFTINPIDGLGLGTYTARVVISNANLSSQAAASRTFTMTITVEEERLDIALMRGEVALGASYTFAQKAYNEAVDRLTVKIANTGNIPAAGLSVVFTHLDHYQNFSINVMDPGDDATGLPTVGVDDRLDFTVTPAGTFSPGTYTARLTVTDNDTISKSFTVSFTVVKANRTSLAITVTEVNSTQIKYYVTAAYPVPDPATYDVYRKAGINAAPAVSALGSWTKIGDGVNAGPVTYNASELGPGNYTLVAVAAGNDNYNETVSAAAYVGYTKTIDLALAAPPARGLGWAYANGVYTITETGITLIGNNGGVRTVIMNSGGVALTLNGVTMTSATAAPLKLNGSGMVTVTLTGTNTLTATGANFAGINVPNTKSLKIDAGSTGTLTAKGGANGAGIGGNDTGACGTVTIEGGTVIAEGGSDAAGIGGGKGGAGATVNISGGTVTAHSGIRAIGAGNGGTGGDTNITAGSYTHWSSGDNADPGGQGYEGPGVAYIYSGDHKWLKIVCGS